MTRMTNQNRVPVLIDRDIYEACRLHAQTKASLWLRSSEKPYLNSQGNHRIGRSK